MKKLLIPFFVFALVTFSFTNLKSHSKILCISDIHFDPFYDTTLVAELTNEPYKNWSSVFESASDRSPGVYGKDANYFLLKSLMQEVSGKSDEYELVVISGDFLSHDFEKNFYRYSGSNSEELLHSFIEKTIYFVKHLFDLYIPQKPVIPALGNNDSFCGDYMLEPGGEFVKMFFECWGDRIPDGIPEGYLTQNGYYDLYYPAGSSYRFVVLNTVYFSPKYLNMCSPIDIDPADEQFVWLEEVLGQSKLNNDKLFLVYHIAPGVDVFSTLNKDADCKSKIVLLWHEEYTKRFLNLVYEHSHIVNIQLAGHIHRDDFRVLMKEDEPYSFIHLNPAVSPVYWNNPSYQLLEMDWNLFSINNAETFYLDLSNDVDVWVNEYNFNIAYGENGVNKNSLLNVFDRIKSDEEVKRSYFQYYTSFLESGLEKLEKEWLAYWCGIMNLEKEKFEECYCE